MSHYKSVQSGTNAAALSYNLSLGDFNELSDMEFVEEDMIDITRSDSLYYACVARFTSAPGAYSMHGSLSPGCTPPENTIDKVADGGYKELVNNDDCFAAQTAAATADNKLKPAPGQSLLLNSAVCNVKSEIVNSDSQLLFVDNDVLDRDFSLNSPPRPTLGRVSLLKPRRFPPALSLDTHEPALPQQERQRSRKRHKTSADRASQPKPKAAHSSMFPLTYGDRKKYVCPECGLGFTREKALETHLKSHRETSPAECPQCNNFYANDTEMREHMKTHDLEGSNSDYAPSSTEYHDGDFHVSKGKQPQVYTCEDCNITFHRKNVLTRHKKCHHYASGVKEQKEKVVLCDLPVATNDCSERTHGCYKCNAMFATPDELIAHVEQHGNSSNYRCSLCGESYVEQATIKQHLRNMHPDDMSRFSCILCGRNCGNHTALLKHMYDHNIEKNFSCGRCGKSFSTHARLVRHMSSHVDKSKACPTCGKAFPDGRALANHLHSHKESPAAKKYVCIHCSKQFGSRSSQQIHVRSHTGERPYDCQYCVKKFADGGTLRKHERIHTGEKPYVCCVCQRSFNQRVVLRDHIRNNHAKEGQHSYQCEVCIDEKFKTAADMNQHYIDHCDEMTRIARQPKTGPRKYMRRRQLQPHELQRLQSIKKEANYNEIDAQSNSSEASRNLESSEPKQCTEFGEIGSCRARESQYIKRECASVDGDQEQDFNGIMHHANTSRVRKSVRSKAKRKGKAASKASVSKHISQIHDDFTNSGGQNDAGGMSSTPIGHDFHMDPIAEGWNSPDTSDQTLLFQSTNSFNLPGIRHERSRLISESLVPELLPNDDANDAIIKLETNYSDFNLPEYDLSTPMSLALEPSPAEARRQPTNRLNGQSTEDDIPMYLAGTNGNRSGTINHFGSYNFRY